MDTITLAGDRVDKKGALTGGHLDFNNKSRLGAQADIVATADTYNDLQKQLGAVQAEIRGQSHCSEIRAAVALNFAHSLLCLCLPLSLRFAAGAHGR